jgi:predicted nucleic acid-binding protein
VILLDSSVLVDSFTADALRSARLYRSVRRARGREIDIAIAACAINREVPLWTLHHADFADIPGLRLYQPR